MRIAIAQANPVVGDVEANVTHMLELCRRAHDALRADLVVFPELALCGYPPEDLLFHRGFARDVAEALERLAKNLNGMAVLVGYPEYDGDTIYNSAILLRPDGEPVVYRKQTLPNYGVFDEKRYFQPGTEPCVVEMKGVKLGITICEDLWGPEAARRTAAAGAEVLLSINGSPYDTGKLARREAVLRERNAETGLPIVYVNIAGGQDELIFDGGSMAMSREGELVYRAPFFVEALELVEVEPGGRIVPAHDTPAPEFVDWLYRALVLGVADYVNKHHFPGVVLGLSGGVDSALTLAVVVLAVAFFMFLLSENTYVSSVARGVWGEIDRQRFSAHFLNEAFSPPTRAIVARRLAAVVPEDAARIAWLFRTVLARGPTADEARIVADAVAGNRARYAADLEAAKRAIQHGESKPPAGLAPAELAVRPVADMSLDSRRIVPGALFLAVPGTREHGLRHAVDLLLNRDASFYLDTRHLRGWLLREMAGLRVLNTFAHTGAFSVAAATAGACARRST
jgi:predicted amidohydrolase